MSHILSSYNNSYDIQIKYVKTGEDGMRYNTHPIFRELV